MSYEIGWATLNLEWTPRVARTEYNDNWEIVRHFTGKDPRSHPEAWSEFNDAVHLDFLWSTEDGPVDWRDAGRVTDMGHAVYMEDGSDYRMPSPSPFTDPNEVLAFNAVTEYGFPSFESLVDYYEHWYTGAQQGVDQVVPGGRYKTLVSGAIEAFGWEMLLAAAGEDPQRFGEQVLGSFFELSLHHCRAWAETSIKVFMCHDDMVWTQGPFMNPAFYRQYIFPRYQQLLQPLREAGKRILFTSDGTYDMFFSDLAEAGVDGFCFEPTNNLARLARDYGTTHALIGGGDCRTLTFGTKQDIEQEVTQVFQNTAQCPGFIFCAGNHLPANIPLENAIFYFELVDKLGQR